MHVPMIPALDVIDPTVVCVSGYVHVNKDNTTNNKGSLSVSVGRWIGVAHGFRIDT